MNKNIHAEQAVLSFNQSEQHVKGKMKSSHFATFERWLPLTTYFEVEFCFKINFVNKRPL
jgi:hypothetical protein